MVTTLVKPLIYMVCHRSHTKRAELEKNVK